MIRTAGDRRADGSYAAARDHDRRIFKRQAFGPRFAVTAGSGETAAGSRPRGWGGRIFAPADVSSLLTVRVGVTEQRRDAGVEVTVRDRREGALRPTHDEQVVVHERDALATGWPSPSSERRVLAASTLINDPSPNRLALHPAGTLRRPRPASSRPRLTGAAESGLAVDAIWNAWRVRKHFELEIEVMRFRVGRKHADLTRRRRSTASTCCAPVLRRGRFPRPMWCAGTSNSRRSSSPSTPSVQQDPIC